MSVICPDCESRLVKGPKISKADYLVLISSKIQAKYLPNLEQQNHLLLRFFDLYRDVEKIHHSSLIEFIHKKMLMNYVNRDQKVGCTIILILNFDYSNMT